MKNKKRIKFNQNMKKLTIDEKTQKLAKKYKNKNKTTPYNHLILIHQITQFLILS